jgi:hypothetical protein
MRATDKSPTVKPHQIDALDILTGKSEKIPTTNFQGDATPLSI